MAYRTGLIILSGAALVALATGIYGYFTPGSGVEGVWGPLVASFGAFCIAIGGIIMLGGPAKGWRIALMALIAVGIVLTLLAAVLLHQWIMVGALAVAALAWLAATAAPGEVSA